MIGFSKVRRWARLSQQVLRLDRTAAPELTQIVTAGAEGQQLAISAEAAAVLAGAARQTPREAKRLLGAAIDEVRAAGRSEIAAADARQALEREGIDPDGLNPLDRELLAALAQARQGALGVRSLAAILGAERASLLRHVEPFLIRQGLIEITPLGRRLTERGRARVGTVPRAAAGWPRLADWQRARRGLGLPGRFLPRPVSLQSLLLRPVPPRPLLAATNAAGARLRTSCASPG